MGGQVLEKQQKSFFSPLAPIDGRFLYNSAIYWSNSELQETLDIVRDFGFTLKKSLKMLRSPFSTTVIKSSILYVFKAQRPGRFLSIH